MSEHTTFWRKKNEQVYIDEHKCEFNNQPVLTDIHKEWRENEYEYFRCEKTKKIVMLTSWDFDYCPFCGKKLAEKEVSK